MACAALLTLLAKGVVAGLGPIPDGPASVTALPRGLYGKDLPTDAAGRALLERAARDRVAAAVAAQGGDSPAAANARLDLAHLLWGLERYGDGLEEAERALATLIERGRDSAELGAAHYQVADLRRATGDYAGALAGYRDAIAIWGGRFGATSIHVANAWHYMGATEEDTGDDVAARDCFARALAIREMRLGPDDPLVANTLFALAGLALRTDEAAAEPLFLRAQAIWERTLGVDHPWVARCLSGRARMLLDKGDTAAARPLLERALAIRLRAFDPTHYLVASSRADMARLLERSGRLGEARAEYAAALDLLRRAPGPAHPEVAATLADLARVEWAAGESRTAVTTALESETLSRQYFRLSSRDLDDDAALRYARVRTSGLDLALTDLAGGAGRADPERTDATRGIVDALIRSRALVLDARTRPAPGAGAGDLGLEDVRRALPADVALAAYVRFDRIGRPGAARVGAPEVSYLAVVVRGDREAPAVFDLGGAGVVNAAVAEWRRAVTTDPRLDAARGAAGDERAAGERLRRVIWDPMAAALAGARLVLVVPDGAIDLVPVAALPAPQGRYLLETGPLVHYLTAERDVVAAGRPAPAGHGVLIVGDPDFDAGPAGAEGAADQDRDAVRRRLSRPLCPEFTGLRFEPLPGAAAESGAIAELAGGSGDALLLTGSAATKESFAAGAPGRRVIHLATHAYVLPERCGRGQPMLRSGLAFAGANRSAGPADAPRAGDGIATAEEIAALDLSGVEWVVLSACDSGLGEVHTGEGVVGLRRAFERAGANTVIMSLWDQDDGAAARFMRALYAGRRSGMGTAEAMRDAGLRLLAARRARGHSTSPYFWGGFVAAGDWR